MKINKKILILITIFLFTCTIILAGCGEKEVATTDRLYVLNGELYSNHEDGNNQDGLILTGGIYFGYMELGVNRKQITHYGFVYAYYCPSTIDPLVLGNDGIYEISIDDVDSKNQINCILELEEQYYNTDIAFRPFIRYTENNKTKVMYGTTYNACNLYELCKYDNCDFAKQVIEIVEKNN